MITGVTSQCGMVALQIKLELVLQSICAQKIHGGRCVPVILVFCRLLHTTANTSLHVQRPGHSKHITTSASLHLSNGTLKETHNCICQRGCPHHDNAPALKYTYGQVIDLGPSVTSLLTWRLILASRLLIIPADYSLRISTRTATLSCHHIARRSANCSGGTGLYCATKGVCIKQGHNSSKTGCTWGLGSRRSVPWKPIFFL